MRESPDIESSTDDYATRFCGATGQYLLEVQNRTIMRLLGPWRGKRVLDVGGGHAQLCNPLLDAGCTVTVLGSDAACFERVQRDHFGQVECVVGDLLAPPFEDRAYDAVVSIRMLAHIQDAGRFIAGICRISRDAVVVDYPEIRSMNAATPLLYRFKRNLEGNTRNYRMFRARQLTATFAAHGFGKPHAIAEFFWPMVLHRQLRCPSLSRALEVLPRCLGLTRLFGSPVCLRTVRT